jgi:two-component system, NtrC family, sensor kinase
MTALPQNAVADLERTVADLERQLQSAATENARLRGELGIALERQNATADILRTIASAPGDAGRSLQQIAETCARLFGAPSVSLQLAEDGEWGQAYRFATSAQQVRSAVPLSTIRIGGPNLPGTVVAENRQIHIPDLDRIDPSMADWPGPPHARAAGTRTMCGTPLRRDDKAIGALIVYRDRLLPFTAEELALLQSFAHQAVIAIENDRLFNETREALERQTATAEILKVIASSPSDAQPVFEAIASNSNRLIGGLSTAVHSLADGVLHLTAFTRINPAADAALRHSPDRFPPSLGANSFGTASSYTSATPKSNGQRRRFFGTWRGCAVFAACSPSRYCAIGCPSG